MSSQAFNRIRILDAFEALSKELETRGIKGNIFVVGGAAIVLAYGARRLTRDVDAIFEPKSSIYEAAVVVGAQRGLPEDWLNDAVKGFAPGDDPNKQIIFSSDSLQIAVASPEYLLAMKLLASRVEIDTEDIRLLYRLCGLRKASEGIALLLRYYPEYKIPPKTKFLLEELYGPL